MELNQGSFIPRPFHPSVCCIPCISIASNKFWGEKPGYEARAREHWVVPVVQFAMDVLPTVFNSFLTTTVEKYLALRKSATCPLSGTKTGRLT